MRVPAASLAPILMPRLNKYIPITPTLKQQLFLNLDCSEALYGGRAGGGKSFAILMAALQWVDVPGYHALILRRSLAHLDQAKALIPISREWLNPTDADWNERKHRWTFPSGSTLTFGYCEHENDIYQYQGSAYHFLGFDELTQFTENQYTYLFSRRRRDTSMMHVPMRFRAASNPGGNEEWVHTRFLVDGPAKGRAFIPAGKEDNPFLDLEDYEASLMEMSNVTERRQLMDGEWGLTVEGTKFNPDWFERLSELPHGTRGMNLIRYWDLAATEPNKQTTDPDWTVGVLMGEYPAQEHRGPRLLTTYGDPTYGQGIFYVIDVQRFREPPGKRDALIHRTAIKDAMLGGRVTTVFERQPAAAGKEVNERMIREVMRGFVARIDPALGDKELRADAYSSAASAGNVKVLNRADWTTAFLKEHGSFPFGSHDDQVDAAAGAFRFLTAQQKRRPQEHSFRFRDAA